MKDFNDFLSSLDSETMTNILSQAMAKGNQAALTTDGIDRADILGNQVVAVSFTVALELLREYHRWLSEEN